MTACANYRLLIPGTLVSLLITGILSCSKPEDPLSFDLSSLMAGSVDLNTGTPPTNVPGNSIITASYTRDVDPSSVTASSIRLYQAYNAVYIDLTLSVSGRTITIAPKSLLANHALYKLIFRGIRSLEGQLMADTDREFTTEGVFVPSGAIAWWNFDNNVNDQAGNFDPLASGIIGLTYSDSYTAAAGKSGYFNGTTTIVEIPGADPLITTDDFTICFWAKADPTNHVDTNGNPKGHFVLGLGAFYGIQFDIAGDYASCKISVCYNIRDTAVAYDYINFNGDGKTGANGGKLGCTYCRDLTGEGGVTALLRGSWAFIVFAYESTSKVGTISINGERMIAQDFNTLPAGDPRRNVSGLKFSGQSPDVDNTLALGFFKARAGTLWSTETWANYYAPHANHFGGWLDDVRIFHKALTPDEVSMMYLSAKP